LAKELDGVPLKINGEDVDAASGAVAAGMYAGTSYGTVDGLIDAITDKEVKAE
jgi:hypothetical protein